MKSLRVTYDETTQQIEISVAIEVGKIGARPAVHIGLAATGSVDISGDFGIIHVIYGDDLIAGGDAGRDAGYAVKTGHSQSHGQIAHIRGLLSNNQVNHTLTQLLDGELGRVKGHHRDLITERDE